MSFVVLLLGFIIFGGVKRIAHFTQVVVPFMAIGYVLLAIVIILMHITALPGILMLIVTDAFTPMAGVGAAIGWGVKRGVYSNEAGQGSGPHAASAAEVQHPAQRRGRLGSQVNTWRVGWRRPCRSASVRAARSTAGAWRPTTAMASMYAS